MRSRFSIALCVFVTGGCQCFSPVSEEPDGAVMVDGCSVTSLATALNRTLLGCSQCIYLLESP